MMKNCVYRSSPAAVPYCGEWIHARFHDARIVWAMQKPRLWSTVPSPADSSITPALGLLTHTPPIPSPTAAQTLQHSMHMETLPYVVSHPLHTCSADEAGFPLKLGSDGRGICTSKEGAPVPRGSDLVGHDTLTDAPPPSRLPAVPGHASRTEDISGYATFIGSKVDAQFTRLPGLPIAQEGKGKAKVILPDGSSKPLATWMPPGTQLVPQRQLGSSTVDEITDSGDLFAMNFPAGGLSKVNACMLLEGANPQLIQTAGVTGPGKHTEPTRGRPPRKAVTQAGKAGANPSGGSSIPARKRKSPDGSQSGGMEDSASPVCKQQATSSKEQGHA